MSLERTEGESRGVRVALRKGGQWRPQGWLADPRQLPWLPSGSQAVQSVASGGGTQEVHLPSPQPAGGLPWAGRGVKVSGHQQSQCKALEQLTSFVK